MFIILETFFKSAIRQRGAKDVAMESWVAAINRALTRKDGNALCESFGLLNPGDCSWRKLPSFVASSQTELGRIATRLLDPKVSVSTKINLSSFESFSQRHISGPIMWSNTLV